MRVSVDVGGTFTDVIVLDEKSGALRLEKVETVPADPASGVLADVRAGYVSIEAAVHDYGVVIDPQEAAVDEAATEAARAEARTNA